MDIKKIDIKDRIIQFQNVVEEDTTADIIKKIYDINTDDKELLNNIKYILNIQNFEDINLELPHIQLLLSTYGGCVYDGLALYDVIKKSNTKVDIICSGKIMSMGIILTLAGHTRKAYKNTTFMIHSVSGWAVGKLEEMEESAEECKRLNNILFDIISSNTKITKSELKEIKKLKKDWFMTAEEALKYGLIDEIIE